MAEAWQAWAGQSEPYGSGRRSPMGSLADAELLEKLGRYKRQVAKRYRVVEPELVERALPEEPLFVSPKLDGELWFLACRRGDAALVTFNGRVLHGISLLDGVARKLALAGDVLIAGELVASLGGDRPRSHHVNAALSDPQAEGALSFHAFDLVEDEGKDALGRSYEARLERMVALLGTDAGSRCAVVRTDRGQPSLVAQRYREWVTSGTHEGVVARSDRGITYKIKPTRTVDFVVLAFGERIVGGITEVRELDVGLVREDGNFQLVGSVGTGLGEEDRVRWHAKLSALVVPSSFRLANREGTLCRFVQPKVVVEVRVSDFLSTDAWDAPIRRMSLAYDAAGYRAVGETRTAVPLHPVWLRERTDKLVEVGHVGTTQIRSYLEDAAEERARTERPASAEIVRRAVFVKDARGQRAVRKYVVVRTHKESDGSHPPWVAFFTDFSPGRREPLETALRTGSTAAATDAIVASWTVENVLRGWVEVQAQRRGAPPPLAAPPAPVPDAAPGSADAAPAPAPARRSRKKAVPEGGEAPAPKRKKRKASPEEP